MQKFFKGFIYGRDAMEMWMKILTLESIKEKVAQ